MKTCPTYTFKIWIAGDYQAAKMACQEFAREGLCASIAPCEYVYTMGAESGVCITLINYPRFPSTIEAMQDKAGRLAALLCDRLFQGSYTIQGPIETVFVSRRECDKP
jgi:hypothetical protein